MSGSIYTQKMLFYIHCKYIFSLPLYSDIMIYKIIPIPNAHVSWGIGIQDFNALVLTNLWKYQKIPIVW